METPRVLVRSKVMCHEARSGDFSPSNNDSIWFVWTQGKELFHVRNDAGWKLTQVNEAAIGKMNGVFHLRDVLLIAGMLCGCVLLRLEKTVQCRLHCLGFFKKLEVWRAWWVLSHVWRLSTPRKVYFWPIVKQAWPEPRKKDGQKVRDAQNDPAGR